MLSIIFAKAVVKLFDTADAKNKSVIFNYIYYNILRNGEIRMKTTKKIFAAILAVMMIALMVPFTASAAEDYSATITGKVGYSATVYKIADVNTTTGAYSNFKSDAIKTILTAKDSDTGIDTQSLLAACETATFADTEAVDTLSFTSTDKTATTAADTFTTTAAGVYYVKVTGTPVGTNVKKAGGAVFALPYYTNSAWTNTVSATLKIEDDTPTVTKTIVVGSEKVSSTTANIGDTITYELTASVVGSKDAPLTEYTIHDNLSAKLDTPAVTSVKVGNNTLTAKTDYTVDTTNQSDIKIALTEAYLNAAKATSDNGFYSASSVVVTLTAKLTADATLGATTTDNSNSDSLTYTNSYGQTTLNGPTVYVYTFQIPVLKQDATTNAALKDAKFTLYSDANCTTVATNGAETATDNDGYAYFTGLKAGTYYLKETAAPTGYNLNSEVITVTIAANGTITSSNLVNNSIVVKDTPIVMPATGGTGTMIFTIVGASLIACAAVLFVVLKKKKAAK